MWTKKQVLVTRAADGTVQILPMRYNASHQRGWRCFLGALAEDLRRSARRQSQASRDARYSMHWQCFAARSSPRVVGCECWADAESRDRFCRRLTLGSAESDLVDGFLPIDAGEAASSISVLNLSPLKLKL